MIVINAILSGGKSRLQWFVGNVITIMLSGLIMKIGQKIMVLTKRGNYQWQQLEHRTMWLREGLHPDNEVLREGVQTLQSVNLVRENHLPGPGSFNMRPLPHTPMALLVVTSAINTPYSFLTGMLT